MIFYFLKKIKKMELTENKSTKNNECIPSIEDLEKEKNLEIEEDLNVLKKIMKNNLKELKKVGKIFIPARSEWGYNNGAYSSISEKNNFNNLFKLHSYINKHSSKYTMKLFNRDFYLYTREFYEKECKEKQEAYEKSKFKLLTFKPDFGL
jgi:hypothetical protein